MLRAVVHGKKRGSGLVGITSFTGAEDLLTASIFERFCYLDESRMEEILRAIPGMIPLLPTEIGSFEAIEFWPSMRDREGRRVEPDVLLSFQNVTLLIEAKRHDGVVQQYAKQLDRQIAAAQQESELTSRPIVQIALGGNEFNSDSVEYLDAGGVARLRVHWRDFHEALASVLDPTDAERRLLIDINHAFALHGMARNSAVWELADYMLLTDRVDRIKDVISPLSPPSRPLRQIYSLNLQATEIQRL